MSPTIDIKMLGTAMTKGHEGPMVPLEVPSGAPLGAQIGVHINIETPSLHQGVLQIIQNPFKAEGEEPLSLQEEDMDPLDVETNLDSNLIQLQIAVIITHETCQEDVCPPQVEVIIGANQYHQEHHRVGIIVNL